MMRILAEIRRSYVKNSKKIREEDFRVIVRNPDAEAQSAEDKIVKSKYAWIMAAGAKVKKVENWN